MIEIKRLHVSGRTRPLGACAPVAVMLLSAYAAVDSRDGIAQEANAAAPVVFVVALADEPQPDEPVARPALTSIASAAATAADTVHAVPNPYANDAPTSAPVTQSSQPQGVEETVAEAQVPQDTKTDASYTAAPIAAPAPAPAPVPTAPPEPQKPVTPMPAIAASGQDTEHDPAPGAPGPGPEPGQPAPPQPVAQPGGDIRQQVFGLATSGGAVRAFEEAKARPDVFSPVDIAQIQELSIRQQVRGGRDKVRAMSSHDRFDALDAAIRDANELNANLPNTPEYAEVRASLAGDLTVAYAARGRMNAAVTAFETIPPQSAISIEALASVGDAYSYLQQPAKSEQVYRRALEQATASTPDAATRGFQYGTHTRPIELREGLFYALTDQDKYAQAHQVLEDIHASLPPPNQVQAWNQGEDDYMLYYRLLAQYQIYIGQTSEGMASLERLKQQVPFSAEVRNAEADAALGSSQTRHARDMYSANLTDHPDNIEALAGLGRASLMLDDYANARMIDNAFDETFPENASVRSFKRDFEAYRAPVLSIEFTGEHGNSVLADNEYTIDTTVYSPPIHDNWRVFSDTFFGHANTDIGNVSRTRTGVGGDYRNGPLDVTAEATRSIGPDSRSGGNGSVTYAFSDYVSASASVDSDTNLLPFKAYVEHLWGKTAEASFNFTDTDRRSASLSYTATRFSDSNFNQEIAASGTQRVFTTANHFVNVTMNVNTSSNTLANTAYFAPSRDYTGELVAMHQWAIWREGEKALVQRIYLTAGAYNERGYGTSAEWGARIEHAWTFSHDITLTYGIGVLSHDYDGSRETSGLAYATLNVPF
jgi:biofilm PGA synthesis protein PgaA